MLGPYRLLSSLAHRLPYPPGTLRASVAGRRTAAGRWRAWAEAARAEGPLAWAHAASVGEQRVLEPVVARLVRACPGLQIVLSHTSPSVPPTGVPAGVCHRDFLPADRKRDVTAVLDALRPSLFLFGRGDLWPMLVGAAASRGIPVAIAGARVRGASRRLGRMARWVLDPAHRAVTWLGAITAGDADRWRRLGVPADRIVVTGDPRHDAILERVPDLRPATAVRAWAADAPVLVAGSVEPSDDSRLTEAMELLRRSAPTQCVVLVPHDPSPARIAHLERRVGPAPQVARWSAEPGEAPPAGTRTLVVTARGRLADLYLGADVAYVGGGFRSGKLHAVAEPAGVGVPVLTGPRWQDAADAEPMVRTGGARVVASGTDLADAIVGIVGDDERRTEMGLAARSVIRAGAAQVTVAAMLGLLEVRGDRS